MHGDPVAFSLEKVSAQSHSRGNPDTAIQRVPFFGSFHRNLQVSPRIMLKRDLAQRFGIEPQLGKRQKAISIDPCIGSADGLLNIASTVPNSWTIGGFVPICRATRLAASSSSSSGASTRTV